MNTSDGGATNEGVDAPLNNQHVFAFFQPACVTFNYETLISPDNSIKTFDTFQ